MEIVFAKSLSGHDRNQIYMISEIDEKFVFLVNGTAKTLAAPKKKSRKHIQIIRKLPAEVTECFSAGVTDITIKKAIKTYGIILNKEENPLLVQGHSHFPSENKEDFKCQKQM